MLVVRNLTHIVRLEHVFTAITYIYTAIGLNTFCLDVTMLNTNTRVQ